MVWNIDMSYIEQKTKWKADLSIGLHCASKRSTCLGLANNRRYILCRGGEGERGGGDRETN